jgi:hypothetical protein
MRCNIKKETNTIKILLVATKVIFFSCNSKTRLPQQQKQKQKCEMQHQKKKKLMQQRNITCCNTTAKQGYCNRAHRNPSHHLSLRSRSRSRSRGGGGGGGEL